MSSDFVLGLSGKFWPLHLKPLQDELLSSWIIRLAHAHGHKVESFCTLLFGYRSTMWNRDIDVLAPDKVKNILKQVMAVTDGQIESTTLQAFEGELFEKLNIHGINHWILSLGINHRQRKRHGLMFCPQCLATDKKPYFRRLWRVAFSTVCTRHNCFLHDECPSCKAIISPHRVDMFERRKMVSSQLIATCWKCGFHLNKTDSIECSDRGLINFQLRLEDILKTGWGQWSGNKSMYSFIYFEGLHQLITGIKMKESRQRMEDMYLLENDEMIEHMNLRNRRSLLSFVSNLIEDWPNKFLKLVHEKNIRYSELKGDIPELVFWYDELLNREVKSGNPVLNDDEKESIIRHVELKQGYYSNEAAKNISGRDISKYVTKTRASKISNDTYDDLLVSLDHEIASTMDQVDRECLIRDKIMFATGRLFNLSIVHLSQLELIDISSLSNSKKYASFHCNAKSKSEAKAWIEWYVSNIRSKNFLKKDDQKIFLSAYTKRGIKRSTISSRFNRAVIEANLHRKIKSYDDWLR